MAGTVIEYLKKYGDIPFREKPLNDVDSLALCQLSYLKFDGMVSDVRHNGPSVTLQEIAKRPDVEQLFGDVRFEKENRALFEGLLSGRRFRNMKLNCYINLVEKEWETQFSAITFILDDGTLFLAFRGTDETIVGWKEDFNMAFLNPVPGQEYSVKYVNMVTGWLHQPFYIGGHSKGGNLAVYSAMKCAPFVQKRIQKIYSLDGPGFRPEVLKECHYNAIEDKVVKLLPHSSMIGMIFERDIHYRVVESKSHGLLQHDPFSWLVKDDHFVDVGDIYESQKIMNEAIAELRAEGLQVAGLGAAEQDVVEQMHYVDDAHIEIEVEAGLPDAYVAQQAERLKLYRELDSTKDEAALQAFESRLADRFGPLPREAQELLNVVRLRWEAIRLGMERVKVKNGLMIVHFVGEENSPFYKSEAFMTLLQRVTQRPDRFVLKQHNNRLAMTVRNVKDVEDAYKTLQQL